MSRRTFFLAAFAAGLIGGGAARAEAAPGRVGVMVDAGVPDGVNGSLLFRPVRWFQMSAGGGTNLISLGIRAGASVYLLPTRVSPTLSAEAGHYFPADANKALVRLGVTDESQDPLLREVGYDYANLHLGLDFGRERFSFYVHAGMSVMRGEVRNLAEAIADETGDSGITVEVVQNPVVTLVVPSARIGAVFYF